MPSEDAYSVLQGTTANYDGAPRGASDDIGSFFGNIGQGISDFFSGKAFGQMFNNAFGVTSSNEFNSAEAQRNRDYTTAERLAAQDYNSAEAQKQRDFISAEAQVARDWQMNFDNTAVQRRIADLQAAGVNPMLAVGNSISAGSAGGATASGGSAASISPGSGQAASASGNSASAVGSLIRALTTLVKVAGA